MRPQAPDWFRAGLSELLALLPTKPLGVRNAIEFIAASNNESSAANKMDENLPSQGPPLPFDALKQASKLLSAVPRTMSVEAYLSLVGPQLMSLLDGDAGPELSQVAAYVIANGFLGKRALGAPGSPGWQYLVEPMQQVISPSSPRQQNGMSQKAVVIGSDRDLAQMLKRMSALIRAYSNTALTGRLLRPLIQSLWAIASFDVSSVVDPVSSSLAKGLLQAFLTLAGGQGELAAISEDLLWDGPNSWTLTTGSEGGIAIVTRESVKAASSDLLTTLPKIDRRVNLLCELISASSVDDTILGDLFFQQLKIWFEHRDQVDEQLIEANVARNPQQSMATAKLVLSLLDRFGSRIASHPENAINLISQMVKQRLGTIVNAQLSASRKRSILLVKSEGHEQNSSSTTMNDDETFDIAISLLTTLIDAPSFKASDENSRSLRSIEESLLSLENQSISVTTRQTVSRALQALSKVQSSSLGKSSPTNNGSQIEAMQQAFKQVQQDLLSTLPPVRTSAIYSLETLMREPSFPLDGPTSTIMLIHLVRSDPEDYVYLAAIRALVLLAQTRDARLVTRLLIDAFQDTKEEAGVDGRLRLGEAVIGIVSSISSAPATPLHRQAIEIINDAALKVASRRGNRRREQDEKKRKARLDRMKKKEAERAWGGEVPEDPTLGLDDDEDYANETPEQKARRLKELEAMETIIKGWENTGPEEDIRIRTTALAIITEILEQATSLLNQQQLTDAIDTSLSILIIESTASRAILRRAAVLTIFALLKSMDRAFEENRQFAVGLEARRWIDVEKVVGLLRDMDPDELVRGHANAVLEGLEAFRMKQILGVRQDGGMQDSLTPRFTLEGRLRGLDVDVDVDGGKSVGGKSKIQEIE